MPRRLAVLKTALWGMVGVLAAITVVRFTYGLGTVTNLSDAAPWGLWIGFDVMAGVALAAGGFVIAATVYIFRLERYRPFARPAILTAFLGYVAVAVGLVYDLGLPWHIWHPVVYPQIHSVLFEVAMCVMLYLLVLGLEFAPVVLEHPVLKGRGARTALQILKRVSIGLVIAGIVLSTLHQSSLGSLFLIAPHRLHALWYSPIIYVLFFVSAVALGLLTVVLESLLAGVFLRHRVPTGLLANLGAAAAVVLALYTALRLGDLAARGVLPAALDGSWQGALFVFEVGVSAVIPMALLLSRRIRETVAGLATAAGLGVCGIVLNRLDVCFIAFARPEGMSYAPSWMEVAVSLGIVAAGILMFLFVVERFAVYEAEPEQPSTPTYRPLPHAPFTITGLMPRSWAAPRRHSLAAVSLAALTVLVLPLDGPAPIATPVTRPRTVHGVRVERETGGGWQLLVADVTRASPSRPASAALLALDGNRDGRVVLFDHDAHVERVGADTACGHCHHLNMPLDWASSCFECHRDMYEPTALFDHDAHVRALDGRAGCSECHLAADEPKTMETAAPCMDCHEMDAVAGPVVDPPAPVWRAAAGYMQAMHDLCITCHERRLRDEPAEHPEDLDTCAYCHDAGYGRALDRFRPRREPDRALATRRAERGPAGANRAPGAP